MDIVANVSVRRIIQSPSLSHIPKPVLHASGKVHTFSFIQQNLPCIIPFLGSKTHKPRNMQPRSALEKNKEANHQKPHHQAPCTFQICERPSRKTDYGTFYGFYFHNSSNKSNSNQKIRIKTTKYFGITQHPVIIVNCAPYFLAGICSVTVPFFFPVFFCICENFLQVREN